MNCSTTDLWNLIKIVVRTSDFDPDTSIIKNEGSGMLCCFKGKTYLLTAGHCAVNWESGNFMVEYYKTVTNGVPEFVKLFIKRKVFLVFDSSRGLDYAIFEVENPNNGFLNESRIKFEDASKPDLDKVLYYTYGYPRTNRNGQAFNAEFIPPCSWVLDVPSNHHRTFHDLVVGLSGSPILSSNDDATYNFLAIQKKTLDNSGSYNTVLSTFATYFKDLLNTIDSRESIASFVHQSIDDHADYIERRVQLWTPESSSYLFDEDEHRYTLYEYLTEAVPSVQSFRFLLLAPAQSGKTYELTHLAHILAAEEYNVAIKNAKELTIDDISNLPQHEAVDGHKTVVIIDAIDETPIGFDNIVSKLNNYSEEHPTVKILVSCRQNFNVDKLLKGFTPLYLSDLTFEEASQIIDARTEDTSRADQLKEYICRLDIRDYAHNIFCLLTLITYKNRSNRLPINKSELYKLFVDSSQLHERGADREAADKRKQERIKFQQKCALVMILAGHQSLTCEELMRIDGVANPDLLYDRLPRSLFNNLGDGSYEFVNNAIREYLAAEYCLNMTLEEFQKVVCFYGTAQIKPQWYNVVLLWLQQKSSQQQPLKPVIIDWISASAKELILQCDATSIDSRTRFLLVQNILEDLKKRRTFFDVFRVEDYKRLYRFAEGEELINYLTQELNLDSDKYIYNVLCLTPYINYDQLQQYNKGLYTRLVDELYNVVIQYGETEGCSGCYYFMYLSKHFYSSEQYVERLFSILKDWRNQEAICAMSTVCNYGGWADNYLDWLLASESFLRQERYVSVHRSPLYKALCKIKSGKNAGRVLEHITAPDFVRFENDADDYLCLLKSILSTIYQHREDVGLLEQVKLSFDSLFIEHPYYLSPSISGKALDEYEAFFELTYGKDKDVDNKIKEIRGFGKISPEKQEQYRQLRQRTFDEMCDYGCFSAKIKAIAQVVDEGYSDPAVCVQKAGYASDSYALNFILMSGFLHTIDKFQLIERITNLEYYEDFRMCEIVNALLQRNRDVSVSPAQIESATQTAVKHLCAPNNVRTHQDYEIFKQAIHLLLSGYGSLEKDALIALLPMYATEHITKTESLDDSSFDAPTMSLLQYAENQIGREKIIDLLTYWVCCRHDIGDDQYILFADYLVKNGNPETLDVVFEEVFKHRNPAVIELLSEKFIQISEFRQKLVDRIDSLNEDVKMLLLLNSIDNNIDVVWAQSYLKELFPVLKPFNMQRAIYQLLKIGSKQMLEYVSDNRENVFNQNFSYIFSFNNPDCLDTLLDLYPYIFKKEDVMHISSSSILVSVGNIAQQSLDLLNHANEAITKITEEPGMPNLLILAENYRTLYYQRMDRQMTIDEAIAVIE